MRRIVFAFLWTTAFLAFVFVVLWLSFRHGLFLSLAITFCTTFYHFAFRLLAATLLNASYNRKITALYKPCNPWFREKTFEPGLYRLLRVRRVGKVVFQHGRRKLSRWKGIPQRSLQFPRARRNSSTR